MNTVEIAYHSTQTSTVAGGNTIDIKKAEGGLSVAVLAYGSTGSLSAVMTASILSEMLVRGVSARKCTETIAKTAIENGYSEFCAVQTNPDGTTNIIELKTPKIIYIKNGKNAEIIYETTQTACGNLYTSRLCMRQGDLIIATDAETKNKEELCTFAQAIASADYSVKNIATMLCSRFSEPATVCAVRISERVPLNVLFGPPADRNDCDRMMSLFFSKDGKKIVCGGTTASIASKYLGHPVITEPKYEDDEIPPISRIEGVDLVTEGVITMKRVLEYATDYSKTNEMFEKWSFQRDAASLICRMMFEEATDICFFVGRAVNPAHQLQGMPINFTVKMRIVSELEKCLKIIGKNVKICYF